MLAVGTNLRVNLIGSGGLDYADVGAAWNCRRFTSRRKQCPFKWLPFRVDALLAPPPLVGRMLRTVRDFHCSFCGKPRREVVKLIAGPRVFICNECVAICRRAIDQEKAAGSPDPQPESQTEQKLRCRFCGKSSRDVDVLIAGPGIFICDACVVISEEIIREEIATRSAPR
jgi:hypothetical protein